jgi:cardiolipin synthase
MSFSWLPNAISILRIALIPPILLLVVREQFGLALALFFIAGFSDGVDGYLAVRFDWQSRLGGLLDPAADKLLMTGMFVTLAWTGHIPVWLASVVILRDVVIVAGALSYNYFFKPLEGEPTRISKINTALQILFVLFVLSRAGFGWPEEITITLLGAAVLVTVVVSCFDYVLSWTQRARESE